MRDKSECDVSVLKQLLSEANMQVLATLHRYWINLITLKSLQTSPQLELSTRECVLGGPITITLSN